MDVICWSRFTEIGLTNSSIKIEREREWENERQTDREIKLDWNTSEYMIEHPRRVMHKNIGDATLMTFSLRKRYI